MRFENIIKLARIMQSGLVRNTLEVMLRQAIALCANADSFIQQPHLLGWVDTPLKYLLSDTWMPAERPSRTRCAGCI